MTVSHLKVNKKIGSNVQLELTGSQMNLSPRPLPATHFSCSSRYQSYPMRRAVSAFGFQPVKFFTTQYGRTTSSSQLRMTLSRPRVPTSDNQRGTNPTGRPLSADNIRYTNKKEFTVDFSENDEENISTSNQDFKTKLSENEFENILNDYSENKQTTPCAEIILKPGLTSKPPLPFPADHKNTAKSTEDLTSNHESSLAKPITDQEAFDEIIALKFKRWFPDPIIRQPGDSSSDDDGDNLELLSYREQKFRACEYRYEVTKKNRLLSSPEKAKQKPSALKSNRSKNKNKVQSAPAKSRTFSRQGRESSPESNLVEKGQKSVDSVCNGGSDDNNPNKINDNPEITLTDYNDHTDTAVNDNNNSLRWLEEQDLRTVLERQTASNFEKSQATTNVRSTNERKSNIMKTNANPYKKQKKISFLIEKKIDDESRFKKKSLDLEEANELSENVSSGKASYDKSSSNTAYQCVPESARQGSASQIDDVLSWMDVHRSTSPYNETNSKNDGKDELYKEMVDVLKDIEQETRTFAPSESNEGDLIDRSLPSSSSAKAIWSLLEEAEKNNRVDTEMTKPLSKDTTSTSKRSSAVEEPNNRNRLSDLLRHSSADLAQKVMALQLILEDKEVTLQNLTSRLKKMENQYQEKKKETEYSFNQQTRLIEQLRTEKKTAIEKLENMIRDMEKKQAIALQTLEESHKIALKKELEKQAAADRMERERWIEARTQKIKENALRGLQPEINRMTIAHQEEISELRKLHKREREELEDRLKRQMAAQKETMEAEKEKALAVEREISRQKLNDEIGELERKYQDQRKRMLAEVHFEQEKMERTNEVTLAKREKELDRKWEIKEIEIQKRIEGLQLQHQEEIQKLQQNLEAEKLIWIQKQTVEQKDLENQIREQCKKERDRDIKLVIEKLENENHEREQAFEQKIRRLKEQYDMEVKDIETANEHLRRKLTESRNEFQSCEEINSQLRTQLNQSNTEYIILKEKYDRLLTEQGKIQNMAKSELSTQIQILQSQLKQAQLTHEAEKKSLESEKERELSRVYNKMKELFMEKDDLINSLKKQKDAALAQCGELEKFLDMKRKDSVSKLYD